MSQLANAPAVEVVGLGYTFPGRNRPTLADVSFSLPAGTFTLVAGPTGSGKSTLLRALVGLIPHLARGTMIGTVRLHGIDTRTTSSHNLARVVGFLQQSPDDQLCTTTVEAELAFGLENLNLPVDEIARRIAEAAARVGLGDQLSRPTGQLSGGMKQRLALAAIMAMRPSVLVCDEPLSRLDAESAQSLLAELRRLRDAGTTVIVAEHRLDALRPLADRVLVLDGGRIVDERGTRNSELGTTRPVSAVPSSAFRVPSSDDAVVVNVDRLEFRYTPKSPPVWSGVSFDVRRGERIALVGPNGAGKSTLLAVLAGVLKPTAGRIARPGKSSRLAAAFVPQRADLTLFSRTVAEELAYGPRQFGFSREIVDERVRMIAAQLGLAELLDEPPQALSQGQRVRTAVAAALAVPAKLLLLDEPTTGQDTASLAQMLATLDAALGRDDGPEAILVSTHDHDVAAAFADRVVTVADGTATITTTTRGDA